MVTVPPASNRSANRCRPVVDRHPPVGGLTSVVSGSTWRLGDEFCIPAMRLALQNSNSCHEMSRNVTKCHLRGHHPLLKTGPCKKCLARVKKRSNFENSINHLQNLLQLLVKSLTLSHSRQFGQFVSAFPLRLLRFRRATLPLYHPSKNESGKEKVILLH